MTHDASDSRPLDLSDLREADTLGQAWDAWLRDDIEPTRHQASRKLAPGIAATVEELYDWDETPRASSSFRTGLKRDLLHMHDALRLNGGVAVPDSWDEPPAPGGPGAVELSVSLPAAETESKVRRFPALRSWLPAIEVAAACVLIAALLGVAFANDRIAEFFRDEESGNFAAQGGSAEPTSQSFQSTPVTIDQGWINVIRDDAGVGLRPDRMTVAEGYVAVVSEHYESESVTLTVFDAELGERLWTATVNTGINEGIQGRSSAPIIADGRLYFVNRAGFLYGFDIEAYPDDPNALIVSNQYPFAATNGDLVLYDGVLYATGGDTDATDGYLPSMVEYDGSLYIAGDLDDSVIGFDLASNSFVGRPAGLPYEDTAQLDDGFGGNGLWQLDLASGIVTRVWREPGVAVQYVSVLDNGMLAVSLSSIDGRPLGISFRDAADIDTEVFAYVPADYLWDPRAFPVGSVAVVMTKPPEASQELLAINPQNPDAAVELPWDYTNAPTKPSAVIAGITIAVVADDDILRVYDPFTGAILGETPVGFQNGEIVVITVVEDIVYAAFEDGTIVQFMMIPSESPIPSPVPIAIPTATLVNAQT